jgi:protein phosphatase 1 regulatory subunit 7
MFKDIINRIMNKTDDTIEKKDGFLFFKNNVDDYTFYERSLIIEACKIEKCIKYIKEKRIVSIQINDSLGGKLNDLSFLKEIPNIESVSVLQENLDLSPINSLIGLKCLNFNESKQKIDFNNFPNLKKLGCNYSKSISNLDKAINLEWLYLHNYNKENLLDFSSMNNIRFLHLFNTSIKNLLGIDNCSLLKNLDIDKAPKLSSLEGLSSKNISLTKMSIYNAKLLTDLTSIELLDNLEFLWLKKIPDVNNLDFLKNSKVLNNFCLGAKLIQKEYSNVINVKKIFIPGYSGNTMI